MSHTTFCPTAAGEAFRRLKTARIVVSGDLLLDTYTHGTSHRLSPEAPVPVVHVTRPDTPRVGGAGNVAMNLCALGAEVAIVGRVGADSAGETLCSLLAETGCDLSALIVEEGYPTPTKQRVLTQNQQLVRIDRESCMPIGEHAVAVLTKHAQHLLEQADLLLLSDYDKGLLTPAFLRILLDQANDLGVESLVDPKKREFASYCGATYLKPNRGEAYAAARCSTDTPLSAVAERLLSLTGARALIITLGSEGIAWIPQSMELFLQPAEVRSVYDVTGAGDTVAALLAMSIASGIAPEGAIALANLGASIAIESVGCSVVGLADLAEALLAHNLFQKQYAAEQLPLLQSLLQAQQYLLVEVNTNDTMTPSTDTLRSLHHQLRTLRSAHNPSFIVAQAKSLETLPFLELLAETPTLDLLLDPSFPTAQLASAAPPLIQPIQIGT